MTYYIQESSSNQASSSGQASSFLKESRFGREPGKEFNVGDTVMYIKGDKKEKVIIINIIPDESPFYEIEIISRNKIKQTVIEFLYIIEE